MKLLLIALVAVMTFGSLDAASARKKPRPKPPPDHGITRDYDGTPIIMQGFRRSRPAEEQPQADRPISIPRGSSTYIPPPVPSPSGGPPAAVLLQPPPAPYKPPPINSFGDRVTNCIHSYPLNKGIGNNPTDQQAYIRQCAN